MRWCRRGHFVTYFSGRSGATFLLPRFAEYSMPPRIANRGSDRIARTEESPVHKTDGFYEICNHPIDLR